MRTYKRKPQEYQLIEGAEGLCRLCLCEAREAVPIFIDPADSFCSPLATRIMMCVGFEILQEDKLSNNVCIECYNKLQEFYKFKIKCETTHQKWKSHLSAIKEQDNIKSSIENVESLNCKVKNDSQIENCGNVNMKSEQIILKINENDQIEIVNSGLSFDNMDHRVNNNLQFTEQELNIESVQEPKIQIDNAIDKTEITQNLDLPLILVTMLTQLGILVQNNDTLTKADGVGTVQLEMGDNEHLAMELLEEDDVDCNKDQNGMSMQLNENMETEDTEIKTNGTLSLSPSRHETCNARSESEGQHQVVKDRLQCSLCGKRLSCGSARARHEREHSGSRPHACRSCGRGFAQREVRDRHELVHKAVRPFACEQCDKSFTQRSSLVAHARTHVAPHERSLQLHACSLCDKVFLYPSGLSRHLSTHKGRLYICAKCDRRFKDESCLLRHLRTCCSEKPPADT